MNIKIVVAVLLIVVAVGYGAVSFVETNVQYADFQTALATGKKVQVKGELIREKERAYDASKDEFVFFMKDENGTEMKVVFNGTKPNNFELADAIVIKGRFHDNCFRASEILTKCPSKYEAGNTTANR